MLNTNDGLLKLNLQFFSDDVIQGGYVPEPREPIANPLMDDGPTAPEPDFEQPTQEEAPIFDFGGRKVNPGDVDAIKGVYEDWQNAQRYISNLQNQVNASQQLLQQFQQQPFQQQQAQPEPVNVEELNEKLLERFYESPADVFKEAEEKAYERVMREIQPVIKQRQYEQEVQTVASTHQDFGEYVPHIQQLVSQMGDERAEQLGLENLYYMAKGMNSQQQASLANDPNYIKQQVLSNEALRNEIMQSVMQSKQQARPQAPVMGANTGGQSPFAQQARPRSIEEATRLAKQYFNF